MKKTRMWLILMLGINIGVFILSMTLMDADDLTLTNDEYNKKYTNQELIYFKDHPTPQLPVVITIISFISPIVLVIFMFKWTTAYNLEICGYKSKGEWKKHV